MTRKSMMKKIPKALMEIGPGTALVIKEMLVAP